MIQRQKKKKRGNATQIMYDCTPPDSDGPLWMQWDVFILSGSLI
jgi:hypothetical protein